MAVNKFSRSVRPRLNTGNHGKLLAKKTEEIIEAINSLNVIAFKENVNLKDVGVIDLDFVSGKNASNTIPQFALIEKANNIDIYNSGIAAIAPYMDITITGGLVAGEVIDFQGMSNGQLIIPSGYTIPVSPTISGVVADIVSQALSSGGQYIVTQINSSTFRITSPNLGTQDDGEAFIQAGNSNVTYTTSTLSGALEGGVDFVANDMEIELDGNVIFQGLISDYGSSLVYESVRGYVSNSSSTIPSSETASYSLNKVIPCNDDFYVNIYVCGLNL